MNRRGTAVVPGTAAWANGRAGIREGTWWCLVRRFRCGGSGVAGGGEKIQKGEGISFDALVLNLIDEKP